MPSLLALATTEVVVLVLAVLYLLIQGAITFVVKKKLWAAIRAVRRATDEKSGVTDDQMGWCQWLLKCIAGEVTSFQQISRDSAFQELDQLLIEDRWNLSLHRLGVAAPLLGVLITAIGIFVFQAPAAVDRLTDLIPMVRPLAIGIGCGAALALVNQALLAWIDHSMADLKSECRTWFDQIVWPRLAAAEANMSKPHVQAIICLSEIFGSLVAEVKKLPQDLPLLGTSVAAAANSFQESMPKIQDAAELMRRAAEDVRHSVSTKLEEGAANHVAAAEALRATVDTVRASSEQLHSLFAGVQSGIQALQEAATAVAKSMKENVIPSQKEMKKTAEGIGAATTGIEIQLKELANVVKRFSGGVESMDAAIPGLSGQIETLLTGANTAMTEVRAASHGLGEAVQQSLTKSLNGLASAASNLGTVTIALNTAGTSIDANLTKLGSGVDHHVEAQKEVLSQLGACRTAAESLKTACTSIAEDISKHSIPSQHAFVAATTSLKHTAEQLGVHVDTAFGPNVDKFQELARTVEALGKLLKSLEPMCVARKQADGSSAIMNVMADNAQVLSRSTDRVDATHKPATQNGNTVKKTPRESWPSRIFGSLRFWRPKTPK